VAIIETCPGGRGRFPISGSPRSRSAGSRCWPAATRAWRWHERAADLAFGGTTSYRALFNWRHPAVYIQTMVGLPLFELLFFTYLGRFNAIADDRYFVVSLAIQTSAIAGIYVMVMSLVNERELGTLSAAPAGKCSSAWPGAGSATRCCGRHTGPSAGICRLHHSVAASQGRHPCSAPIAGG